MEVMSKDKKHEEPGASREDSQECATYLKALADPIRLQVVRALQQGPMSVSDLAILLELEMANISHHLRVLFHADIVTTKRDGKFIYYGLNSQFRNSRSLSAALDFGCCKLDLRD
jgi:DNA-binding transcriptional ArsR family regulator